MNPAGTKGESEAMLAELRASPSEEHQFLADWLTPSPVPCGSCHACCHGVVELRPDQGDDPAQYETAISVDTSAPNGLAVVSLARRPNGDCVYLKGGRCSIHERRPHVCRSFDCRKMFLMHTREERRALVAEGSFKQDVFDAGRKRQDSLPGGEAFRARARRVKAGARAMVGMQRRRGMVP